MEERGGVVVFKNDNVYNQENERKSLKNKALKSDSPVSVTFKVASIHKSKIKFSVKSKRR